MITAMIDAPALIRTSRVRAGLSQRELARRAGTSAATLSRYESGQIDPTIGTLNRIVAACARPRRRWPSLASLGPVVSAEQDHRTAWRLVGEFLDDSRISDDDELLRSVMQPPLPTGSSRTDALLPAIAEHLCAERNLAPPQWTQIPIESVPWWFVAGSRFAKRALIESPVSFARRGIFITAGALERV